MVRDESLNCVSVSLDRGIIDQSDTRWGYETTIKLFCETADPVHTEP